MILMQKMKLKSHVLFVYRMIKNTGINNTYVYTHRTSCNNTNVIIIFKQIMH